MMAALRAVLAGRGGEHLSLEVDMGKQAGSSLLQRY